MTPPIITDIRQDMDHIRNSKSTSNELFSKAVSIVFLSQWRLPLSDQFGFHVIKARWNTMTDSWLLFLGTSARLPSYYCRVSDCNWCQQCKIAAPVSRIFLASSLYDGRKRRCVAHLYLCHSLISSRVITEMPLLTNNLFKQRTGMVLAGRNATAQ